MEYSHIGWIPCINGHLDFGLMVPGISGSFTNNSLADPKTTRINYGYKKQNNHHSRRIILQSKLDWRDRNDNSDEGHFRVVVVAESNEDENLDNRTLTGKLFLYPLGKEPNRSESGISSLPWFDSIHKANTLLNNYKPATDKSTWKEVQKKLNLLYKKTDSALTANTNPIKEHFYGVNFTIDAHGFAQLLIPEDTEVEDEATKYLLLRQAFYYIKYSLHTHKHHFIEEDSLTTIVPLYEVKDRACFTNIALKLLGQLKRELTCIKRTYSNGGQKAFGEEQGIISYMNSLCVSLRSKGFIDDKILHREQEYLKSLSSSFSVQSEKREKKESTKGDIRSKYRVYVGWSLSLIGVLWLVVIKGFVSYEDKNKIELSVDILGATSIFVVSLICVASLYLMAVNRKIENTLDTKGLISWVERCYIIDNKKYIQKRFTNFIYSIIPFLVAVLLIIVLHFFVS